MHSQRLCRKSLLLTLSRIDFSLRFELYGRLIRNSHRYERTIRKPVEKRSRTRESNHKYVSNRFDVEEGGDEFAESRRRLPGSRTDRVAYHEQARGPERSFEGYVPEPRGLSSTRFQRRCSLFHCAQRCWASILSWFGHSGG